MRTEFRPTGAPYMLGAFDWRQYVVDAPEVGDRAAHWLDSENAGHPRWDALLDWSYSAHEAADHLAGLLHRASGCTGPVDYVIGLPCISWQNHFATARALIEGGWAVQPIPTPYPRLDEDEELMLK